MTRSSQGKYVYSSRHVLSIPWLVVKANMVLKLVCACEILGGGSVCSGDAVDIMRAWDIMQAWDIIYRLVNH